MKYFLILTLIVWNANSTLAQHRDSSELRLANELIAADWLKQWEGVPTQWYNNMEVFGYSTVDKNLKFSKDSTFEIDVFYDQSILRVSMLYDPNYKNCKTREEGYEVSVLSGTWAVKKDSVYLTYQKEIIYDASEFINYDYERRTYGTNKEYTLKAKSSCPRNYVEVYTFLDNQLCLNGESFSCFK